MSGACDRLRGWAEQVRRGAGRAVGTGGAGLGRAVALASTPVVHPWMRQDPQRVRDLGAQLDGHLARLDAARARTTALCPAVGALNASQGSVQMPMPGPAASPRSSEPPVSVRTPPIEGVRTSEEVSGPLGLTIDPDEVAGAAGTEPTRPDPTAVPAPPAATAPRSAPAAPAARALPAAHVPSATPAPPAGPIDDLRAALEATRDAFLGLADALETHAAALAAAHRRLGRLQETGLRVERIAALRREIRQRTDALSAADVTCRQALEGAIRVVPDGAALARLAVPDVGIPLPAAPTARDARALREHLRDASSERIRDVLSARPELGEILASTSTADVDLLPTGIAPGDLGLDAASADGPTHALGPDTVREAGAEGDTVRGAEVKGDTVDGAAVQGDTVQGDAVDGAAAQRDAVDGAAVQGDTVDGAAVRGDTAQGAAARDGAEQEDSALRDTVRGGADPGAERVAAIEARRESLAGLGDRVVAAGLLWPGAFGALDGAPVAARIAANRILCRVELGRARRADVELEVRAIARRVTDSQRWWRTARARLLQAWLRRDRVTSFVTTSRVDLPGLLRDDLRVRILLFQGLLYDPVVGSAAGIRPVAPTAPGATTHSSVRGRRRLLLFEPAVGRGRLAELWGPLDERTAAVAVLVPGTGTAVRGFHLPTRVARDLAEACSEAYDEAYDEACAEAQARADADVIEADAIEDEATTEATAEAIGGSTTPEGARPADVAAAPSRSGTAVIAWMGADFPLAIGTHAPFARFARAAAPALRDFVAGLPLPPGSPLTVLGHSYGGSIIGAADLLGLRGDRIVHIASPGAGPGVRSAGDYPAIDPLGRPRSPVRYSLTAPGDPVAWAQRFEAPWGVLPAALRRRLQAWGAGLSLGVDPARLRGVRILPAGVWEADGPGHRAGDPLVGRAAHAGVTARGTSAFRRLVEVVGAPL